MLNPSWDELRLPPCGMLQSLRGFLSPRKIRRMFFPTPWSGDPSSAPPGSLTGPAGSQLGLCCCQVPQLPTCPPPRNSFNSPSRLLYFQQQPQNGVGKDQACGKVTAVRLRSLPHLWPHFVKRCLRDLPPARTDVAVPPAGHRSLRRTQLLPQRTTVGKRSVRSTDRTGWCLSYKVLWGREKEGGLWGTGHVNSLPEGGLSPPPAP